MSNFARAVVLENKTEKKKPAFVNFTKKKIRSDYDWVMNSAIREMHERTNSMTRHDVLRLIKILCSTLNAIL